MTKSQPYQYQQPHVELEDEKEEGDGQNKGVIALHPSLYDCNFTHENVTVGDGTMEIDMKIISTTIFRPVVSQVIEQIKRQFDEYSSIDHMVLTGGFSQSDYFSKVINSEFNSKVKSIRSFQDSENIAMKGAVLYGLYPDSISKRTLRWTYGIKSGLLFQSLFNSPKGKDDMNWLCRKNNKENVSEPVVGECETTFPPANFAAGKRDDRERKKAIKGYIG
jgi:hypothetical protein